MAYTKFNSETGEIECIVNCPDSDLHFYQPCIEGSYSAEEYMVIEGEPVRRSDADIEAAEIKKSWVELRNRRNNNLSDSDWTQVPDAPVDSQAWATYRQALRDLPANTTDPRDVAWPEKP